MKTILNINFIILIAFTIGCQRYVVEPDFIPPSPPWGLATATGDNLVELSWYRNSEPDVAGYNVYVSSAYDGKYLLIGSTHQPFYVDHESRNGTTYYYAVTAYDFDGNESEFSHDVAYETPRPEGYNVFLKDYRISPSLAGYDFSTYSIGQYNDQYTDIYFENYNGEFYLNVWEDSDIQDVGYTQSLYDVRDAPVSGWSPTKDVRLIVGHTYVVWTWDNHFAKVRFSALSSSGAVFDWAYQLQSGNTSLKRSVPSQRSALEMGVGAKSRM